MYSLSNKYIYNITSVGNFNRNIQEITGQTTNFNPQHIAEWTDLLRFNMEFRGPGTIEYMYDMKKIKHNKTTQECVFVIV